VGVGAAAFTSSVDSLIVRDVALAIDAAVDRFVENTGGRVLWVVSCHCMALVSMWRMVGLSTVMAGVLSGISIIVVFRFKGLLHACSSGHQHGVDEQYGGKGVLYCALRVKSKLRDNVSKLKD